MNKFRKIARFSLTSNTLKRYKSSYFVTTPIFYVNAKPHIGHLYSAVVADATLRFEKLQHDGKFIFGTGTDEHGVKIEQAATDSKLSLSQYCDGISEKYLMLFKAYDIDFTDFIRTTEERHRQAVHHFWKRLYDQNEIRYGVYTGWYSVPDETFLSADEVDKVQGPDGCYYAVSLETGQPLEYVQEDNFLFCLRNFDKDLLHWLKTGTRVRPAKFQKQVENWLADGFAARDLSISRPKHRVQWGLTVPNDENQTIYVWFDALINYLTIAGYPKPGFEANWPPDVQVVGKDILKFHGIFWPAFLMAAGLEPPRLIHCHSHWTVEGEKISKRKGNVIDPMELGNVFTHSGLRYFLLREGVPHSDGNYSEVKAVRILNSELADTLGNLLGRCCGKSINPKRLFPSFSKEAHEKYVLPVAEGQKLIDTIAGLTDDVKENYGSGNFYKGITSIILCLHEANRFFEVQKPWESGKDELQRMATVHVVMEVLRVSSILLQPIVPRLSEQLLRNLGIADDKRMWKDLRPFSWEVEEVKADVSLTKSNDVLFRRIQKL